MHDKPSPEKGDPLQAGPSLRSLFKASASGWYAMRHPIIAFIGFILTYGLALCGAVISGMLIGILVDEELAQRKVSAPVWYQVPVRDHTPGPKVFKGVV